MGYQSVHCAAVHNEVDAALSSESEDLQAVPDKIP